MSTEGKKSWNISTDMCHKPKMYFLPEVTESDEGEEEDEEGHRIPEDLQETTQFRDENFVLQKKGKMRSSLSNFGPSSPN